MPTQAHAVFGQALHQLFENMSARRQRWSLGQEPVDHWVVRHSMDIGETTARINGNAAGKDLSCGDDDTASPRNLERILAVLPVGACGPEHAVAAYPGHVDGNGVYYAADPVGRFAISGRRSGRRIRPPVGFAPVHRTQPAGDIPLSDLVAVGRLPYVRLGLYRSARRRTDTPQEKQF